MTYTNNQYVLSNSMTTNGPDQHRYTNYAWHTQGVQKDGLTKRVRENKYTHAIPTQKEDVRRMQ